MSAIKSYPLVGNYKLIFLKGENNMGPEVKKAMEEVMMEDIKDIRSMTVTEEGRDKAIKNIVMMAEVINTADQIDEKWVDNSERRALDEKKAKEANETELKKSKLTAGKVALEVVKIFGPLAVGVPLYLKVWKGNLKFEETGRICSSTARELRLPKIFKF